jgi:hypothetical protein
MSDRAVFPLPDYARSACSPSLRQGRKLYAELIAVDLRLSGVEKLQRRQRKRTRPIPKFLGRQYSITSYYVNLNSGSQQ